MNSHHNAHAVFFSVRTPSGSPLVLGLCVGGVETCDSRSILVTESSVERRWCADLIKSTQHMVPCETSKTVAPNIDNDDSSFIAT